MRKFSPDFIQSFIPQVDTAWARDCGGRGAVRHNAADNRSLRELWVARRRRSLIPAAVVDVPLSAALIKGREPDATGG
jgi:hypothetical protein